MHPRTTAIWTFILVTIAALIIFWVLPEAEAPPPEEVLDGQPDVEQRTDQATLLGSFLKTSNGLCPTIEQSEYQVNASLSCRSSIG